MNDLMYETLDGDQWEREEFRIKIRVDSWHIDEQIFTYLNVYDLKAMIKELETE